METTVLRLRKRHFTVHHAQALLPECGDVMGRDIIDAARHEELRPAMVFRRVWCRRSAACHIRSRWRPGTNSWNTQIGGNPLASMRRFVAVTKSDRVSILNTACPGSPTAAALFQALDITTHHSFSGSSKRVRDRSACDHWAHLAFVKTDPNPFFCGHSLLSTALRCARAWHVVYGTLHGGSIRVMMPLSFASNSKPLPSAGYRCRGQESSSANPGERIAAETCRGISAMKSSPVHCDAPDAIRTFHSM